MGMRRQSIFLVTTDECEVDAYDVHSSMGRGFVLQSKVPHETSWQTACGSIGALWIWLVCDLCVSWKWWCACKLTCAPDVDCAVVVGIFKLREALRLYWPPARKPGWRFTARHKFTSRVAQDFLCISIRKMNITQNLWIRLTPDQFSGLPEVETYPEMDSLCLSMRFRKSCSQGKVFFCNPEKSKIWQKSKFFKMQQKTSKQLLEASGELLGAPTVVWSTFECL